MYVQIRAALSRFRRFARKAGLLGGLKAGWARLIRCLIEGAQNESIESLAFVTETNIPKSIEWNDQKAKTLNWLVPDFGVGSGGHTTIFRMVYHLEELGFNCNVIVAEPTNFQGSEQAHAFIRQHYFPIKGRVSIGVSSMEPAWGTIATAWKTAYLVREFQATQNKYYFVQDYEPAFYQMSSEYVLAEETYRFGFYGITAGSWLKDVLKERYGMEASAFSFSVDHDIYKAGIKTTNDEKRVLFYVRPATRRRGYELGILALAEVVKRRPDVEIVLIGADIDVKSIPFACRSVGVTTAQELAYWFNNSDVALVLSLTNLSLLPLEIMACGCVVVSNNGSNVEWLLNKDNSVLTEPTVEALCEGIIDVLQNDRMRKELIEYGKMQVKGTDWAQEAEKIAEVFRLSRNR